MLGRFFLSLAKPGSQVACFEPCLLERLDVFGLGWVCLDDLLLDGVDHVFDVFGVWLASNMERLVSRPQNSTHQGRFILLF